MSFEFTPTQILFVFNIVNISGILFEIAGFVLMLIKFQNWLTKKIDAPQEESIFSRKQKFEEIKKQIQSTSVLSDDELLKKSLEELTRVKISNSPTPEDIEKMLGFANDGVKEIVKDRIKKRDNLGIFLVIIGLIFQLINAGYTASLSL